VDAVPVTRMQHTPHMGHNLWVDDERPAPQGWLRALTSTEAIGILERGGVSRVSLDHDLGDDAAGTGYDVLLWIERKVFEEDDYVAPEIRVHTANSSARTKMELGVAAIKKQLAARKEPHVDPPDAP
jgi:hypothetical protein